MPSYLRHPSPATFQPEPDPMGRPLYLLWVFVLAAFAALVIEAATGTYWGYGVFLLLIPPAVAPSADGVKR
jgi:hypothetical protein